MGMVVNGSTVPKVGLKVDFEMLGAVEKEELDDAPPPAMTEILEYEESLTSLLYRCRKMENWATRHPQAECFVW